MSAALGDDPAPRDPLTSAIDNASSATSVLMLAAQATCLVLGSAAPLAMVGVPALGLVAMYLLRFERPRSWWPTVVTSVRLLLTCALAVSGLKARGLWVALTVIAIFVLDGVDGAIARRTDSTSRLGGHLDAETDALLVASVCTLLYLRGGLGPWVLIAGLLRYAYALLVRVFPSQGQVPRSRLGASAFGIGLMSLTAGFLGVRTLDWFGPLLANALLGWSFGRSFYWSFRRA